MNFKDDVLQRMDWTFVESASAIYTNDCDRIDAEANAAIRATHLSIFYDQFSELMQAGMNAAWYFIKSANLEWFESAMTKLEPGFVGRQVALLPGGKEAFANSLLPMLRGTEIVKWLVYMSKQDPDGASGIFAAGFVTMLEFFRRLADESKTDLQE